MDIFRIKRQSIATRKSKNAMDLERMNYQKIIDYFYGEADSELKDLLIIHSRAVADKALRICNQHPELEIDCKFVETAAMLHDIGIIQCDAPGIHCHGERPYIQHGLAGEEMLMNLSSRRVLEESRERREERDSQENILEEREFRGKSKDKSGGRNDFLIDNEDYSLLQKIGRVCSHHTGAGITKEEIAEQQLPLPLQDFMPETLEEKVICYADKFFSKTRPKEEKSLEHVERSLSKFGEGSLKRFREWHELFQ